MTNTNAKTCKQKPTKKAKCKMASPISNDRAEAFVGPKADFLPRFSEVPSERDKRAFDLAAKGMKQREIAKELKTSQPTVQRAIKKYRLWFGSTLPEDRGELVGWQRFRVAVEEQRIFLRHQQELAMEEWEQSRQSVKMKRKRTKLDPEGQKMDGMPIKDIQIDEWVQHRRANASHLNTAAKRSLERTMLEAGYLGVCQLSCDEVIDVDERDRWDRNVKSYKAKIEELTRKVAELETQLEAKLAARVALADEPTANSAKPIDMPSARQPVEHPREARSESALAGSTSDESGTAPTTPVVNHISADSHVASPLQKTPSGEPADSRPADFQSMNQVNPERRSDEVALAGEPTADSPKPLNVPSARQPVEQLRNPSGTEASPESALAVKGRMTSYGNLTHTRPLTASATRPPEGGTPTCPSADEVALRRLQIRRLNSRH